VIAEIIVTALLSPFNLIISQLPTISVELPYNVLSTVSGIFGTLSYFFPIMELLPILVLNLAMDSFRIIMALIVRVKSFIPTMGA
jgi:hypothetical protein